MRSPSCRMLCDTEENRFTGSRTNDAMINFSTSSDGQRLLIPLEPEQITGLLPVFDYNWFELRFRHVISHGRGAGSWALC